MTYCLVNGAGGCLKIRLERIVIDNVKQRSGRIGACQMESLQIILCDVSMPDIDGLCLLLGS
jgi:CheY-like chemotaxis protein